MSGPRAQPPFNQAGNGALSRETVARASAILFVAITLGRLLGFVRDATIAHLFGQSRTTDLFNMAFVLPDLLYFLLAGGALTAAFIPVFTDYLTRGKPREAWQVFSIMGTFLTLVVGALVLLGEVLAVPLVRLLLSDPKFTAQDVAQCARLMRIVLPAQVCFLLGGLMMGALQSHQRFFVPALGPLIYNAAIIVGGLLLAPRLGIAGFSWGALVGAVVGNVLLQYAVLRRMGLWYRPLLHLRHPGVRRVGGMMGAVTLSLALPQILVELNRVFAQGLPSGVVSALANTNRLMQAPLAMFGQALAVALLPTLSAQAARRDTVEFRQTLGYALRAILFATVPVSALMIALSQPLVRLVFEHGQFTAADTAVAAPILAVYCTGVAAWSVQAIVARACFALGDNRTPVMAGLGVLALFVVLNLALAVPFGGAGLAGATSLSGMVIALAMTVVVRRHLGGIGGRALMASLGKTLLASAPMALTAWMASVAVSKTVSTLPATGMGFVQSAVGVVVGSTAFVALAVWLRIPEAQIVWAKVRQRALGSNWPKAH